MAKIIYCDLNAYTYNDISDALSTVLQLKGREFTYKNNEQIEKKSGNTKEIGLITEEVEAVMPSLISQECDNKQVNYQKVIPLLLEALKEQQAQIVSLENKISDLIAENNFDIETVNQIHLSSNYPNPFSNETKVDYYIKDDVKDAKILVYDINGKTINTFTLSDRNRKGNLTINKKGLKSGLYFYTLMVGGNVFETRKMLVK